MRITGPENLKMFQSQSTRYKTKFYLFWLFAIYLHIGIGILLSALFSRFSTPKIPELDLNLIIYMVCVQFAPSWWKQLGNQSEHIPFWGWFILSTLASIWTSNYFHLNHIQYTTDL